MAGCYHATSMVLSDLIGVASSNILSRLETCSHKPFSIISV